MTPDMRVHDDRIEVRWGSLLASVESHALAFAHLGTPLELPKQDAPEELAAQWDARYGKRRSSRRNNQPAWNWCRGPKTAACAEALRSAVIQSGHTGVVIRDTMRNGSDYWRPGKLLSQVAASLAEGQPTYEASFSRDDAACPPPGLLDAFMSSNRPFAWYADAYANYLRDSGTVERTAAEIVLDLARDRLPVFFCSDPYIPGYCDPAQVPATPYLERSWTPEPGLRSAGCHRVILASELVRHFRERGLGVILYEADPTAAKSYRRRY
jgi:hypothetical protein